MVQEFPEWWRKSGWEALCARDGLDATEARMATYQTWVEGWSMCRERMEEQRSKEHETHTIQDNKRENESHGF